MDPFWLGFLGVVLLLALIILRIPIAFALVSVGTVGILCLSNVDQTLAFISPKLYAYYSKFTFTAVPLFLMMGYLAFNAGLTDEAYDAARALLGNVPGGLAVTTVGACALFAASAGSSLAECAAMSKIAVPEMRKSGYSIRLATGVVASAGGMAVVIPPSIIMIFYGVITETSVGELLIAGILPGVLYAAVFAVAIILFAYINPKAAPRLAVAQIPWRSRLASIRKVWGIGILFGLVIGGIYSGLVTPTEAAALGVVSAAVISAIKKKLAWGTLKDALVDTVKGTSMLFLLVGCASIFTLFLSLTGLIDSATTFLIGLNFPPVALLICLFILYIILGMFLDAISMMLLTFPMVIPILEAQGLSLIWFGVIICMLVEIGCITPPMGLNVYAMKGALGDSVDLVDIFAGAIPFVILQILIVIILYIFPQIALWLPGLMIGPS